MPPSPPTTSSSPTNTKGATHDRRNSGRPPVRRPRQLAPPHRPHAHIPPHRRHNRDGSHVDGLDPNCPYDICAITTLVDLAAAANILANAIANCKQVAGAQSIFKLTRAAAHILDIINKDTPSFTPTFCTYRHFKRAAETRDSQVLSMLLIDVIRIANHITES